MNGQKERLVGYLAEDGTCGDYQTCEECECSGYQDCIHEARADSLLKKGVIVPPVRLGETIYILITKRWRNNLPPRTFIKKSKLTFLNMERVLETWGKTIFGTYPEAAKAWAEMEKKER